MNETFKKLLTKKALCDNVCLSTEKCFSFRKKYKGSVFMAKKKEETKEMKKGSLKEVSKKDNKMSSSKSKKKEKRNIFASISNFFSGVKTEFKRVKWPSRKDMVKYSIATIIFIVCCSLFFYLIDVIIAALHSLGK